MSRFDLVILDLDGTLADTSDDIAASVNVALERCGLKSVATATVKGFLGGGARMLIQRCIGKDDGELTEKVYKHFAEHYSTNLLNRTALYEGVKETLDALKDVVMCVVTNKPEAMSRAILAGLGITHRFSDVIGGDTLPERKPHPGAVELLLKKHGVAKDRCLFVGDSMIDLETARSAGVACCIVTYGYPKGNESTLADHALAGFRDILNVVGGHCSTSALPFIYRAPGDWSSERIDFPIPFAPEIPYKGFEQLRFSPGMFDRASPNYFTYLFFWWIERCPPISRATLENHLTLYFKGLSAKVGKARGIAVDLTGVSSKVELDKPGVYRAIVETLDPFNGGIPIALNVEITIREYPATGRTCLFFVLSPRPRDSDVWERLREIRDTFECAE